VVTALEANRSVVTAPLLNDLLFNLVIATVCLP
jgi:hypothetical protein